MAKRVLIIDDQKNMRLMARLALEASGYEVGEAESGMETFALLGHDDTWDAILLDWKLPGLVGTQILRRLKVMVPAAQVIMMTGFASAELAIGVINLGAVDFIQKPMTPELLRSAVAAALPGNN